MSCPSMGEGHHHAKTAPWRQSPPVAGFMMAMVRKCLTARGIAARAPSHSHRALAMAHAKTCHAQQPHRELQAHSSLAIAFGTTHCILLVTLSAQSRCGKHSWLGRLEITIWTSCADLGCCLQVFYAVKVEIQICTSSSDAGCRSTNVVLNPDAPSASASDGAFYASLVGDLNAFDPPPDLTNMVLAVPVGSSASNCNGVNDPQVSRELLQWVITLLVPVKERRTICSPLRMQCCPPRCNKTLLISSGQTLT